MFFLEECVSLVYSQAKVKKALSSALTLMTALAWREEALTGRVSKYNWLARADLFLFCEIKQKYIIYYGQEAYNLLENQILNLLPLKQKISPQLLIRKTILSESCISYR